MSDRRGTNPGRSAASCTASCKLCIDHVLQADEGADLDFLRGNRGAFAPRDNH